MINILNDSKKINVKRESALFVVFKIKNASKIKKTKLIDKIGNEKTMTPAVPNKSISKAHHRR